MKKQLEPEELQFNKFIHEELKNEMDDKKITPAHVVEKTHFLHSNFSRDKKNNPNHSIITFRRKCAPLGIHLSELIERAEARHRNWLIEEEKKKKAKKAKRVGWWLKKKNNFNHEKKERPVN